MKEPKNYEIDNTDLNILAQLSKDAKKPYTEVAKKVFVSGGTVHVRMKKMEDMGIVKGAHLDLDYAQLGYDVQAFLGTYLQKNSMYDEVADQLTAIPEIISINYTTGAYSIFVKLICRDTKHLRDVLHDKVQKIDGIERTETFISLEERMNRPVALVERK
jgi:Lrp/AsnC family transcriptional regulator for asnA, asnC and gidA